MTNDNCHFNSLIERAAPLPAVGRTREIHHAQSMLFGNPARLADYDHTITRLERVPIYTLAAQESASTPLDIPYLHRPFFIGSFHVQERVWIAEEKLNDLPFDLLSLTFQIRRGERMVSGDRTRGKGEYNGKSERCTNKMFHIGFRLGRIVLKDKCGSQIRNPSPSGRGVTLQRATAVS